MASDPEVSTPPLPSPPDAGDASKAPSPPALPVWVCESAITAVVVHGRGARVTRQVRVPEATLPKGRVELKVGGVTARALRQGMSVKLTDGSPHQVLSLHSEVFYPEQHQDKGPALERSARLQRELRRARLELEQLKRRASELATITILPARSSSWRSSGPLRRVEQALTLAELISARQAAADARMLELREEIERLERSLASSLVDAVQSTRSQLEGEGEPTTTFVLSVQSEGGKLEPFELTYLIEEARWWPAYALRLSHGGTRGTLSLDAMVTQDSGEDWEKVELALSTALLHHDAKLPVLPALKLGKAQPVKRSGYRELPDGLDRLFAAYDGARGVMAPPLAAPAASSLSSITQEELEVYRDGDFHDQVEVDEYDDAITRAEPAPMPSRPMMPQQEAMKDRSRAHDKSEEAERHLALDAPARAKKRGGFSLPSFGYGDSGPPSGGAPPAPPMAMPAPAPMGAVHPDFARRAHEEPTRRQSVLMDAMGGVGGGGGGGYGADGYGDEEQGMVPARDWLDFEALELIGPDQGAQRGKLQPRRRARRHGAGSLAPALEKSAALSLIDPLGSRGHYDHRFDALARADVPSDGRLHRVDVARAEAKAQLSWLTIPLETSEVFRKVTLQNPYDAPLLTGPLDVFAEGSFLLSTTLSHIDRGGSFFVGLGVDERVRVARNVRTSEEQLGLLGGKTSVDHHVTITLTSNLGFEASVQVIDRIPITYQESIEIQELDHTPLAKPYTQRDRQHAIEGGRSWQVTLPAGGEQKISSHYRIVLSSKEEIIGGNRRG